ncbi:ribonuclease HII [Hugenholtzia roseola]|uniref:ribonuclease HII n=1 Tax=Hugenholtzia roseola TaxID=1002 RepID=UPI0004069043|nr:ribonuclease HII [Hugenholtzia roseola]
MLQFFYEQGKYEVGVDEVGRGCLAGSVVAAAVLFAPDFAYEQHKEAAAVRDSKKIPAPERVQLDTWIRKEALAFGIGEATAAEIDALNILQASFLAMHRAIEKLENELKIKYKFETKNIDLLLIDGNRFKSYQNLPHLCVVKGDAHYFSIAAASILAKNYRDSQMQIFAEKYPHYGWETNVGYPTAAHRKAIQCYGITDLHRKSFNLLNKKNLLF